MPQERRSCLGMSPRSGAGEAKTRPARLTINRSPHPSTETGELHVDFIKVCGHWYKIRFRVTIHKCHVDGIWWLTVIRLNDADVKLLRLETYCPLPAPRLC